MCLSVSADLQCNWGVPEQTVFGEGCKREHLYLQSPLLALEHCQEKFRQGFSSFNIFFERVYFQFCPEKPNLFLF